ncbi:pentatricopeptide repeat-containing protein At4g39952, mitochondrial isoform X2 [Panicum hallii]|uniref:pentatricopeptide repeat-containing protein At4g39952, mitochondrial isoform X2 n=1 Tax=Panicum hallii TaxID=206008 RepID=UPI000DF4CE72|nr:pentatricopeptide repeat-containing protein At4g39952, mitochondrial isoform X2 [Panicum hallii]
MPPPQTATPLAILSRFLSSPSPPPQPELLRVHALAVTSGLSARPDLAAKLVSAYSSAGRPGLAALVFSASPRPDAFLWNSLIRAHHCASDFAAALAAHRRMLASGARPSRFTAPLAASAAAELGALGVGASVHAYCVRCGLLVGDGGSVAVASSLVYMYARCGVVGDAVKVFEEMPDRDVVAWTAVVSGCVRNWQCADGLRYLVEMIRLAGNGETRPNSRTMESGLEACGLLGELNSGRCLHGYVLKIGVGDSPLVASALFSMYSKCHNTEGASVLFPELPEKDVVSWTSLIGAYCWRGLIREAMELFQEMEESDLQPDEVLVSCLLAGLGKSGNVLGGKAFHALITKRNFEDSVLTGNALISMYGKFELVDVAGRVFRSLHQQNAESWNLMIVGYWKAGCDVKCLELYRELQFRDKDEFLCDANSLVSAISSCSRLEELRLGQSSHCYSVKHLLDDNLSVANVLIGMYGRCRKFDHACKIFALTKLKGDVVTWNALISSYAYLGHLNSALSLYDQMLTEGLKPNSATLITVISACANLATLERAEQIHSYVKDMGWESDVSISTALVDMYAKCGQLGIARRIFDSMLQRDVVAWNVMISGCGMHGEAKQALELFDEMESGSVKPNGVTFLAILSACCHSGFVEEGRKLFTRMAKYSLEPNLKHYACMVDLLGKCGHLQEAEDMVLAMPVEPDGGVWGTLLTACKVHDNFEMGLRIAKKAFASDPENDGYYILMSNSYGSVQKWDEIEKLREMMKNHGVEKGVGWSAVDNRK